MQHLYAPWRMEYVGVEQPPGCLFCRLRDQAPAQDRETLVVAREPGAIVVLNRFPYNSGHVMVAPHQHAASFEDLDRQTTAELMAAVRKTLGALRRALSPQGFNVGANIGRPAGAGIPDHFHLHIVPRWDGDTNFMPVLAEVKVVNEHLDRTWEKLTAAFSAIAS